LVFFNSVITMMHGPINISICKAFGSTSCAGGHTFVVPLQRIQRMTQREKSACLEWNSNTRVQFKPTNELYWRVIVTGRCRWPGRRRRGSSAARLLGLRVLIRRGGMNVRLSCLLCVVKVDASATGRSLFQRSRTEGGVYKLV
jgi:hypothetical protein